MRINDTSNNHFRPFGAYKESKQEKPSKHIAENQTNTPEIIDTLELSGEIRKLDVKSIQSVFNQVEINGKVYWGNATEIMEYNNSLQQLGDRINEDHISPPDGFEQTFEKYNNSELMSLYDTNLRNSYYSSMFTWSHMSMDEINSAYKSVREGNYVHTDKPGISHIDDAVARYNELRDKVTRAFEGDADLLKANLRSLDRAFESSMRWVSVSESWYLHLENTEAKVVKNTGEPAHYETHALAKHKDFNAEKFRDNTNNLLIKFAAEYAKQSQSGDNKSAWTNAVKAMIDSTKTTSVNNLSFSDYMIFAKSTKSTGGTMAQTYPSRTSLHDAFVNDPNLSEELRKILGIE